MSIAELNRIGKSFTVNDDAVATRIDSLIANSSKSLNVIDNYPIGGINSKIVSDTTSPVTLHPPVNIIGDNSADHANRIQRNSPKTLNFANQKNNNTFAGKGGSNDYVIPTLNKKTKKKRVEPDAPSPVMTPNNIAYYGDDMNQNRMFSHENMIDEVKNYKPSEKDKIYNFSGSTMKYPAIPDVGITANYRVDGWSKKDNNYLDVSVGTKQHIHRLDMSGNVEVKRNGQYFSSDKLKYSPHGYIYETGGTKPLGEARVKLPTSGKYDVNVNVFGLYNDGTGRYSVNYTKKLPYGQ